MKEKMKVGMGVILVAVLASVMVVTAQMDPYVMNGYVKYENGTGVVGANITFTNQRTLETIYYTSATNGAYSQNALNFPSQYQDNDTIQYYTVYSGYTNTTSILINVTGDGGGTTKNIILNPTGGSNASVTVYTGSIAFGNLHLNDAVNSEGGDTQTISTAGADGNQKIEIKLNSSTVESDNNHTVLTFVTGSPGSDQLKCEFKGGDVGAYTSLTALYQEYDNSMAAATNSNLDIQLTMPSSVSTVSYYDTYQYEIIVKATLL